VRIDAIPIGKNPPDDINVIIEVPVGGEPIKYEMDKEAGTLVVDRFLYTPDALPGELRLRPAHLVRRRRPARRADRLHPRLVPGCVINCRPIGVLVMEDEAGTDEK
jgi:inorganic pyrophosphatase